MPFKKVVMFDEFNLTVYSIGWLALVTQRHPMTIRKLEYQGILPEPIFDRADVGGDYRYYCAAEIVGYGQIISQNPRPVGGSLREGGKSKGAAKRTQVLKQKLHEFRTELKKQLDNKRPTALLTALPNEARLEAMFTAPKADKDLRAKALKILNR